MAKYDTRYHTGDGRDRRHSTHDTAEAARREADTRRQGRRQGSSTWYGVAEKRDGGKR